MNPTVQRALSVLFQVMHLHTRGIQIPDQISNCSQQIGELLSWMTNGKEEQEQLEELLKRMDNHLFHLNRQVEKG